MDAENDNEYHDLPFDFIAKDGSNNDISGGDDLESDDGFNSTVESLSSRSAIAPPLSTSQEPELAFSGEPSYNNVPAAHPSHSKINTGHDAHHIGTVDASTPRSAYSNNSYDLSFNNIVSPQHPIQHSTQAPFSKLSLTTQSPSIKMPQPLHQSYQKPIQQSPATISLKPSLFNAPMVPHRGSLKRILSPNNNNSPRSSYSKTTATSSISSTSSSPPSSSSWPMYSIAVAIAPQTQPQVQCTTQQNPLQNNLPQSPQQMQNFNPPMQQPSPRLSQFPNYQTQMQNQTSYNVLFHRNQYEFCTRLFALLDTECQTLIGPECIRDFVLLYCPVVRRRDEAVRSLGRQEQDCSRPNVPNDGMEELEASASPTFDEIWEAVARSDPRFQNVSVLQAPSSPDSSAGKRDNIRIGLEGWMLFCRLLALAHHQESQRRFASRHLQQMMRHKYGSGSGIGGNGKNRGIGGKTNSNEVVVMVDNPPPGPPAPISIRGLMIVEEERCKSGGNGSGGVREDANFVQGWPFCPLPLPELDLDQCVSSICGSCTVPKGRVTIEPFSTPCRGDFILRFHNHRLATKSSKKQHSKSKVTAAKEDPSSRTMVVRRSYSDFVWLNEMLKLHKRPGHGYLCGRILPPFPANQTGSNNIGQSIVPAGGVGGRQKDMSEKAVEVAKSGVGMITSMAKSFWGSYVSSSSESSPSKNLHQRGKISPSTSIVRDVVESVAPSAHWLVSSREDDTSEDVAHRMERYLNFLLENPVLSISFPLNAILNASQSGLESAKQTLQENAKQKKRQRATQSVTSADGKPSLPSSVWSNLTLKKSSSYFDDDDDTPWVRAAAQVAMALQFHGVLETTGHETTSAKIQHASLPKFGNHSADSWDEEEKVGGSKRSNVKSSDGKCFESGVIRIDSELGGEDDSEGYDLLPSPGPTEEHHVLNAGCLPADLIGSTSVESDYSPRTLRRKLQTKESQFLYGTIEQDGSNARVPGVDETTEMTLGSVKIDRDIDKVRAIARTVESTLGKLHQSSMKIQAAQQARNETLIDLLRDIDSWGESRGEVINQRALVDGVANLEQFSEVIRESNTKVSNDLSWQSLLSKSAVTASNEVRDAVKASRTATRAKSAALTAARKAKEACESCDSSSTKEEIQSAKTHASNTQSHAIHATVVEYEADSAKKRAAVALAYDVKCWNIHRKREILRTCQEMARSQQESCKQAAAAWERLRDGFIESPCLSFNDKRSNIDQHLASAIDITPEFTATLLRSGAGDVANDESEAGTITTIEDHYVLNKNDSTDVIEKVSNDRVSVGDDDTMSGIRLWESDTNEFSECVPEHPVSASNPLVEALDSEPSNLDTSIASCKLKDSHTIVEDPGASFSDVYHLTPSQISLNDDYFSLHHSLMTGLGDSSSKNEDGPLRSDCEDTPQSEVDTDQGNGLKIISSCNSLADSSTNKQGNVEIAEGATEKEGGQSNQDNMTMSMQSLIDGLMSWGDEDGQGSEMDDGGAKVGEVHQGGSAPE